MPQATPAAAKQQQGFTLLEMLLAIVLFAVGVLAAMDLLHRAQASTRDGDDVVTAAFLAQRCQEQIRRLTYSSLSTQATLDNACTIPSGAAFSRFSRTITATPQTGTSPYNTANLTRLDVQVAWSTTGGPADVTLSTLRANY